MEFRSKAGQTIFKNQNLLLFRAREAHAETRADKCKTFLLCCFNLAKKKKINMPLRRAFDVRNSIFHVFPNENES